MSALSRRGHEPIIKVPFFLSVPQEVAPLHSFYTTEAQFAVALISPLSQSACSQSVRCSETVAKVVRRCRWFLESGSPGEKIGACPVRWCPGLAASSEVLLSRRMETLKHNREARASGCHRRVPLFGVTLRDDLSPRRKTAVRTSAITMRLGWLARAAFVTEFALPQRRLQLKSFPRA